MVLITLIAGAVLFVFFILAGGGKWFSRHKFVNGILIALSLILFLGSETLMILNEHSHFGMKDEVTTKRVPVYSVVPASAKQSTIIPFIMLRRNIGRDPIYIYNVNQQGKPKMNHSGLTDTNRVETTSQTPYLLIQKTRRTFENDFYRQLFTFSGQNHLTVSITNVFYLPVRHQVMTTQELQKMQAVMKKKQAMQQQVSHNQK